MKILQVGLGNNPGGVESFVINYYRQLSAKGIQFDFVCMYGRIAYEEEITQLGGHIYYIPNVKQNYFGYIREFRKVLQTENYDVVHVNMLSAANIVPLRLAYQEGVKKIIAHSHNASAPGLVRNLMNLWNRPKIKKYANIKAACGEAAAEWMFGKTACDNHEVAILQNAIDVDKYLFSNEVRKNVREEFGWQSRLVIGHVGRFEAQKNHKKIIEIFYEVTKREPKAVLCLIGEGVLKHEIESAAQQYGIKENVFFAGVREDVAKFLSAMDVFLFPSLFEGLPFTLIEAQANGLPCVTSNTITKEACIAENVVRLSLELEAGQWADWVLKYQRGNAQESDKIKEQLIRKHFHIKEEASELIKLYQE